jgi:uncharacterized protein with FMN-binding domain
VRRAVVAVASTVTGLVTVVVLNGLASPASLVGAIGAGSTTTRPPTSGSGPPSGPAQRVVGPSEQYGFGALSIRATLKGSRILDVSLASLQTAESYSQMLAQAAIPVLKSEVLAAQSANVNGVSGATYTSQAYLLSLQGALDTARP